MAHRVASSFDLFFDLCFMVAIARAGAALVHTVTEGPGGSVGQVRLSSLASASALTLPVALYLLTVRALPSRRFTVGVAQRLVLPVTALVLTFCTFLGDRAVLAAGVMGALAVATGVTRTARTVRGESGTRTRAPAS